MKFYIKPTHKQPRKWEKIRDLIRDNIHNTVNRESEKNTDSWIIKSHD